MVHVRVPADSASLLVDEAGLPHDYTGLVALDYRPVRPLDVQLTLVVAAQLHQLHVPRDLLLTGADITGAAVDPLWQAGPFRRLRDEPVGCFGLCLELGRQRLELLLPRPSLVAFLRMCVQLVPVGQEGVHVDWDGELADLTGS